MRWSDDGRFDLCQCTDVIPISFVNPIKTSFGGNGPVTYSNVHKLNLLTNN